MNRFKLKFIVALMIPFLASCFDTHPYDVEVTGERGINSTNISKIEQITKDKDTIRFVCMSDSHQWYTDTDDAVADINRRKDSIDFVIHCGDITDTGTRKELKKWRRRSKPFLSETTGSGSTLRTKRISFRSATPSGSTR